MLWMFLVGCGTEIGDEGPADCIDDQGELVDPAQAAPGFPWSAVEAADTVAGAFGDGQTSLVLTPDASEPNWTQSAPNPDADPDVSCPDRYGMPAGISLQGTGLDESGPGWLDAIDDGTARLYLDLDLADVVGSARPTTFDPADMARTTLKIFGSYDGGTWDVTATWLGETDPQGEDGAVEEPTETLLTARLQ